MVMRSARLEEEHCDLSHVEIDEVLGFVGDVGSEIPAHNCVPGGVVLFIEFLLDVGGDILLDVELFQGHVRTVDGILLHLLVHVSVLYHCFSLGGRHLLTFEFYYNN